MLRLLVLLTALTSMSAVQASAGQAAGKPAPVLAKPTVLVNLNTATTAELQQLPGIGERTAVRIVEYRQKNGPFKKIEELMNVQGIGEKSFLKLRTQITVAPPVSGAPQD